MDEDKVDKAAGNSAGTDCCETAAPTTPTPAEGEQETDAADMNEEVTSPSALDETVLTNEASTSPSALDETVLTNEASASPSALDETVLDATILDETILPDEEAEVRP